MMSIWIPATISVASQDFQWLGQQEKLSQSLLGRCRRQSWGQASFPWHSTPIGPTGRGAGREWGGCKTPVQRGQESGSGGNPRVFGLRAEELQNAAFWGLSRGGGLA